MICVPMRVGMSLRGLEKSITLIFRSPQIPKNRRFRQRLTFY